MLDEPRCDGSIKNFSNGRLPTVRVSGRAAEKHLGLIGGDGSAGDIGGQVEITADGVGDAFVAVELDDEPADGLDVRVAVGGGTKGNGKKAREGLVRAYLCDEGVGFEAECGVMFRACIEG